MKIIKAASEHAELVGYVHSNTWKSTYRDLFPKQYMEMDTAEKRKEEFLNSVTNDNIQYYLVLENDFVETGETRIIHRGDEYIQMKYEMQSKL